MSQSNTTDDGGELSGTDRRTVRRAIRKTIRASNGHPERDDLVAATTTVVDAPERVVRDELENCEREGFVQDTDDGVCLA